MVPRGANPNLEVVLDLGGPWYYGISARANFDHGLAHPSIWSNAHLAQALSRFPRLVSGVLWHCHNTRILPASQPRRLSLELLPISDNHPMGCKEFGISHVRGTV